MLLPDPMVAVTFAENGIGSDPTGKIIVHFNNYNNTIICFVDSLVHTLIL